MSRCITGWRIEYRDDIDPKKPWMAWHPRGFTRFCPTWERSYFCVYEFTCSDWERVDGVWVERAAVEVQR
jgi:hypothetical protein